MDWRPVFLESNLSLGPVTGSQAVPPGGTLTLFTTAQPGDDQVSALVQAPYGIQRAQQTLYPDGTLALWRGCCVHMPDGGQVSVRLNSTQPAPDKRAITVDWHPGPPAEWMIPLYLLNDTSVALPPWSAWGSWVPSKDMFLLGAVPFAVNAAAMPGQVVGFSANATFVANNDSDSASVLYVHCRR